MAKSREPIRVVVTGLGAVTSQGSSAGEFWEKVSSGTVAIRPVERLPMEGYRTTLGGEVKNQPLPEHEYRHPDGIRDEVYDYALKASEEALAQCGVHDTGQIPPERWGVVIGTCNGGMLSGEKWYEPLLTGETPDPELALLVPPQALAEALAGAFGAKGPVLSVNTACAASANAIGYASDLIRTGRADAVLTGGSEALSRILYAGFNALESLSPHPAAPYSRDREGLSLGEGSGMLVLMSADAAERAGAEPIAEVLSYSLSADGYHPTAPHPEGLGAGRAIKAALQFAGVAPAEVGYVNSHGTGTAKNDPAETAATKVGLGDAAYTTAVSSTKSMIGHLLGAAGAVENIITVKALEQQIAPPTANYTEADPECDLDYVPNEQRALTTDVAVSNNFAFGGANASIVWARAGARPGPVPRPDYDRVVITGLSALTSAGLDLDALWAAHAEGRTTAESEEGLWVGRVPLDAKAFLGPKERKRVDRLGLLSVISSRLALEDSGIELTDENRTRVGVIVGTGVGPMESMEDFCGPVLEEGPAAANPAVFPNTVYNAAGGQVAMKVGAIGVASTITTGHAAGASAIAYAYDLAACGQADAVIAVAADALTDTLIGAYKSFGVLADGEPGAAGTRGFALSEGGIALVLERLGLAEQRGAHIYGELLGFGITSDAKGIGSWDRTGDGIERAMRVALEEAGLEPGDITAIWANTAGLRSADRPEQRAIRRMFGDGANVVAPKLKLGEPIGAGGALNTALALASWRNGGQAGPVLVNSLSLGGTNLSLALAPYGGR